MQNLSPDQLPTISGNEFLPRLGPWTIIGGGLLLSIFTGAIALSAVLKYNVAVKAPANVRPAGDLRVVQAAFEGSVEEILAQPNQQVKQGDPIARIDDSRLLTNKSQLQGDIEQNQRQLTQVNAQLQALDTQIAAEMNVAQRGVQAAEAELTSRQRQHQDQRVVAQGQYEEAVASLDFAEEELQRFQELSNQGVISERQLSEKKAAVAVARAKVAQAESALDPTNAEILKAQQGVAQAQAAGTGRLATLRQQREQLVQNQIQVQQQINRSQKELRQLERDLQQSTVRAPIAGTILQLNLRNPQQVVTAGEAVASIAPQDAPLLVKAQVSAEDIDKVKPGQVVQMRVSACPFPDFGTLKGTVQTIAPDVTPATATTPASYEVTVQPRTPYVGTEQHQCRLQAGMEGSSDIISHEETVLQFVLRKARLISNV
jgi:HlyD family secretion protein